MATRTKGKIDVEKLWADENAPIEALRERQAAEREALQAKIREEVLMPIEEWRKHQGAQIAAELAERADVEAEWAGEGTLTEQLKARAERAQRLYAKSCDETRVLQTRQARERPDWSQDKLQDADQEAGAIMEAIDHAANVVWALRARLEEMSARGLLAVPETASRYATTVHYKRGEALPVPLADPPLGIRQTPWLALSQGWDVGLVELRAASCADCGRLHFWTSAEDEDPAECRACGAAMAA